jgi:hypothetical protein
VARILPTHESRSDILVSPCGLTDIGRADRRSRPSPAIAPMPNALFWH